MAQQSTSETKQPSAEAPNPNIHSYMQLASMGYGNTSPEDHMGVDQHPIFNKKNNVDPILNLLAHSAHPVEDSPSSKDISDKIQQLATIGADLAGKNGRKLDDDHVLIIDGNQPKGLELDND